MTCRVLVVEDEAIIAEDLRARLSDFGYTVVGPVGRCEDAVRAAEEEAPDIVLMDIVLKGERDGIEAAKAIRERFDLPVIFLTAHADGAVLERAKTAAPYGYIVKPVEDRELKAAIEVGLHKAATERKLRATEKYEVIARLAGGVAHKINNLMTVVVGYSDFLLQSLPADGPARVAAGEIQKAGEHAAAIASQLLSYSRNRLLVPTVVEVADFIEGIAGSLAAVPGEGVFLYVEGPRPLSIVVDKIQFRRAIEELVANAREASRAGGVRIVVRWRRADVAEGEEVAKGVPVRPGAYVVVEVADDGCGMDEATRSRIFDPFVSSKEFGRGLGLPSIYGFVRQSDGYILVDSAPGGGTTVSMYLPLAAPPGAPAS